MSENNINVLSSSLGVQRSEKGFMGLKSRYWQGCIPSQSLGKDLACLFQFVETDYTPWFMVVSPPLLRLPHLLISDLPTSLL